MLSMANGSNLSFKLLIRYLLTLLPAAMAALSKFACLQTGLLMHQWWEDQDTAQMILSSWSWTKQGHEEAVSKQSVQSKGKPSPILTARQNIMMLFLQLRLSHLTNSWRFFSAAVVCCWPATCLQNYLCKDAFNSVSCTPKSLQRFGHSRSAKTCNVWNMLPPCPM